MKRQFISFGTKFEEIASYSRALRVGNIVYLSGTTGYDYATGKIDPDAAEQARQIFRNAERAFAEAGARLSEVVRVRIYAPTAEDFEKIVPVIGERFRGIMPASTGVLASLIREEIRVEIEMEAVIGSAAD
jgi:enamine deaminase RidA (YjgF/YER057c/UK114 family)